MKIVYCGAYRLPNQDAASQRVLNNARALKESGHEIIIISWGGAYREEDRMLDGRYTIDGIQYVITNELGAGGRFVNRLRSLYHRGEVTLYLLREQFNDVDVIITYNASNKFTKQVISFCIKRNIKIINDITEWYDNKELHFFQRYDNWVNMTKTQHKVKNKIVISRYLDTVYNGSHNLIIPATCDATETKWQQGSAAAMKKVGDFDGITLIYAGTPARKDAVHYAINAVQRLIDEGANIRFLIVGAEREHYLKTYAELLANRDLSDRIQFLGRVPQEEVPSYYALADFMLLLREPTRKSNAGFPTKFSESFTSGTPVIANLTSDLGQYLLDGKTGFVVKEPTEEAVYETLKNRVIGLTTEKIENMKFNVRQESKRLDYHYYVDPLREFMSNLK